MNLILFTDAELLTVQNCSQGIKASAFLKRRDIRALHLYKVLHKEKGETFDAGVLGGKIGSGIIAEINNAGLTINLVLNTEPPPRTPICLGVGFPRPIQLRRLLRDCASLGLSTVDLIYTELGEKSYRDTKLLEDGGAQAALAEGAVQARDTRLPILTVYPSLAEWLETKISDIKNQADTIFIAADNVHPQGTFTKFSPMQKNSSQQNKSANETNAVLAVGSERGWSDNERHLLESNGFVRLSFGSRSLRTETACIAAAMLVMEKIGLLD